MTDVSDTIRETKFTEFNDEQIQFLDVNQTMILAHLSRVGEADATVVYYVRHANSLYVLTKNKTKKYHSLMSGEAVTAIVYDEATMTSLKMKAHPRAESDSHIRQDVFNHISQKIGDGVGSLPIAQLDAGNYVVFRLRPIEITFHNYSS